MNDTLKKANNIRQLQKFKHHKQSNYIFKRNFDDFINDKCDLETALNMLQYEEPLLDDINFQNVILGFIEIFINDFLNMKNIIISGLRNSPNFDVNVYYSILIFIFDKMKYSQLNNNDKFQFKNETLQFINIKKDKISKNYNIYLENNKNDNYMFIFKDDPIENINMFDIKSEFKSFYNKYLEKYKNIIKENKLNDSHNVFIKYLCFHFYVLTAIIMHIQIAEFVVIKNNEYLLNDDDDDDDDDDDADDNDIYSSVDDNDDGDDDIIDFIKRKKRSKNDIYSNDEDDYDADDDERSLYSLKKKKKENNYFYYNNDNDETSSVTGRKRKIENDDYNRSSKRKYYEIPEKIMHRRKPITDNDDDDNLPSMVYKFKTES